MKKLFMLLSLILTTSSFAQMTKEIIVDPEWAKVDIHNTNTINFGNDKTEISYSIFVNDKFFAKFRAPLGWRESIIESVQTVLDHAESKGLVAKLIVKDQRMPMVMIEEHPEVLKLKKELQDCQDQRDIYFDTARKGLSLSVDRNSDLETEVGLIMKDVENESKKKKNK